MDSITNLTTTYECNIHKASCGCSIENVVLSPGRVIGGEEAVSHSWAMVVSVRLNDSVQHLCGGSILTQSYIITSARCVDGVPSIDMSVAAGMHNRITDFEIIRYVHNIYIHPHWNASDGTYQNDIALLYVFPPLPVSGNDNLARTCVPYISSSNETVNHPSHGSHLALVGWGSTQNGSHNFSDTVQQSSLYTIDNNDANCLQSIHDIEKQFCAGMSGGGNEKCPFCCP
jgi:secreted trypsin-like serine protease